MRYDLSRNRIVKLIALSKIAEPYSPLDREYDQLDGEYDSARMIATSAKRSLDKYFKENPSEDIKDYLSERTIYLEETINPEFRFLIERAGFKIIILSNNEE